MKEFIFDEFHELIQDKALFYLFIEIMKIRNKLVKTNTLLLSATPNIIDILWSNSNFNTTILPQKTQHYPAIHKKPYILRKNTIYQKNSVVIYNAIINAQLDYLKEENAILIHSKFEENRMKEIIINLYENYGKNSLNSLKKLTISAPIIQASFDISFQNLSESVSNPDNTIQRIGRVNRWGEYNESMISFFMMDDKSEKNASAYDDNLSKKWFNILNSLNNNIILDEFYELYNKFMLDNFDEIKKYNSKLLKESKEFSEKIYPIRYTNKIKPDFYSANSNKLRTSGKGLFIIIKKDNGEWSNAFNDSDYYRYSDKYGDDKTFRLKDMEELINDKRFKYEKIAKKHKEKITFKTLEKWANRSDRPLLVYNRNYNDELGIYDIENRKISLLIIKQEKQ